MFHRCFPVANYSDFFFPECVEFKIVLQILFYFDIVFTTIFTIEIALKVKPRPLSLPSSLCQSQLSAGRCLSCR